MAVLPAVNSLFILVFGNYDKKFDFLHEKFLGIFRTVVIANSISTLTSEAELSITREDMTRFKKLAKRPDIFQLLSKSLAPSIHGHEYVKRAILCLLLGGTEKILQNGTRLRGYD